jgi:hypothetical protein
MFPTMSWERAVHFAGPVALFLIALRPLTRRRGHHAVDRRTAWLCLLGGVVWPVSALLRLASGTETDRLLGFLDSFSIFFGGVLFAYGFWALRRVRFSLHSEGNDWSLKYRKSEKGTRSRTRSEGK